MQGTGSGKRGGDGVLDRTQFADCGVSGRERRAVGAGFGVGGQWRGDPPQLFAAELLDASLDSARPGQRDAPEFPQPLDRPVRHVDVEGDTPRESSDQRKHHTQHRPDAVPRPGTIRL